MAKELRILSLNCWLLPAFMSSRNVHRTKQMISLLREHNPDVIALQEVWLSRYVRLFEKALPEYMFTASRRGMFITSGLVMGVSRHLTSKKGKSSLFPISKRYSMIERIARKGYQTMILGDITIINTHLYASKDNSDKRIANSQFRIIQGHCRSKAKDCIIAGDFNMREHELKKVNGIFDMGSSKDDTAMLKRPYVEFLRGMHVPAGKRIDYILKKKGSRLSLKVECIKKPMLSDHCALIGIIGFPKK